MSIENIQFESNNNISDVATIKLYAYSALFFLTVAMIPSFIFN